MFTQIFLVALGGAMIALGLQSGELLDFIVGIFLITFASSQLWALKTGKSTLQDWLFSDAQKLKNKKLKP